MDKSPKTESQTRDEQPQVSLDMLNELKREIALLRSIQDKSKLLNADQNFTNDKRPLYRYRIIEGKIVSSWGRMKMNDVRIIRGDIVENQVVEVTFYDGTTKEYSYKDFNDGYTLSEYARAKEISVSDIGRIITFDTEQGEIKIHEKFLN
jgi:hypothetical protein